MDRKTRRQGDREDKAKRAGVDKGGRGRRGRRELDERWDGSGAGRRSKAEEKARPSLRGKASPGGKGCSYTMVTTVQVPLELELK